MGTSDDPVVTGMQHIRQWACGTSVTINIFSMLNNWPQPDGTWPYTGCVTQLDQQGQEPRHHESADPASYLKSNYTVTTKPGSTEECPALTSPRGSYILAKLKSLLTDGTVKTLGTEYSVTERTSAFDIYSFAFQTQTSGCNGVDKRTGVEIFLNGFTKTARLTKTSKFGYCVSTKPDSIT
ncbi:hypothetical protein GN244_ATG13143 [Phytophthora infestans]|uniref:Uncharacterized protein n=1 Tax=Phytophthora infestans TaxID=4787 RepID=A0A833RWT5_PHYIN|nr:hypothetical protein GN244_ATG13143 [Phytophthora infestans]